MTESLVTLVGGGGFLGRYIAQEVLRAGARLRIVQRDPRSAWFLKPLGGLGQIQFVAADVKRPDSILRAIAGSSAVVNLVGTFGNDMHDVHVKGAATIARAAADTAARAMVHVSALGADADSLSRYGRTKAEGEAAVRAAFPGATILQPSTVFGREDQFINRFAAMIAQLPIVPVMRAGTRFQPVWVADVASAAARAIAAPDRHGGKTYALGGPDAISMGALNRWIAEEIGRKVAFAEVPDLFGAMIAMAGFLPGAPISWDQWQMLQSDNVVPEGAAGFAALDIEPTPLAAVAPAYLVQYRRHGRFADPAQSGG